MDTKKPSSLGKWLAVAAVLLSIVYIVMPIDFDGPIIGIFDDFFFFMAAFCFCQSRFISSKRVAARRALSKCAIVFATLGAIWLVALFFIVAI